MQDREVLGACMKAIPGWTCLASVFVCVVSMFWLVVGILAACNGVSARASALGQ